MKTRLVASFALVVGLLMVSGPLLAHHGEVAYDTTKIVVVKDAMVTQLMWTNPHTFIKFDAKDDQGVVQHWVGEAGSPNALTLRGWTQNTVQPGDLITVYIFQSKSGRPVGRLNKIVLPDGKEFRDSILGYEKGSDEKPDAKAKP